MVKEDLFEGWIDTEDSGKMFITNMDKFDVQMSIKEVEGAFYRVIGNLPKAWPFRWKDKKIIIKSFAKQDEAFAYKDELIALVKKIKPEYN